MQIDKGAVGTLRDRAPGARWSHSADLTHGRLMLVAYVPRSGRRSKEIPEAEAPSVPVVEPVTASRKRKQRILVYELLCDGLRNRVRSALEPVHLS